MISTRCIKTALMSLALTTPALMDSVPKVNGLKLTMRVNGGNPLQPEQTPLSNSEKTEELPDQNGVHATTPLQMVEEHEEDHLTESERQIMLSLTESERLKVKGYVDDGLNFKDATKLVLLENELRQLDTIITSLEDELTQIESEQRMLD